MNCFEECGCRCRRQSKLFDDTVLKETRFDVRLQDLLSNHVGSYLDHSESGGPEGNDGVGDLGLRRVSGVYVLWRQHDNCDVHKTEHLRAYYVGKAGGSMHSRLLAHQSLKGVGNGLTTEVTIWRCPNRQAKYIEQLLLDLYYVPLNEHENPGSMRLCHHVGYGEWN